MVYTLFMFGGNGIPSDLIYIDLVIQDPQTDTEDDRRITTYEIALETNSISFILKSSRVRRRFEDFVWLREQLQNNHGIAELPALPGGGLLRMFGRQFDKEFIRERQKLLQQFTEKIVREPEILSDPTLHLFLQTQLSPHDILKVKKGQTDKSVLDTILAVEESQLEASSDSSGFVEVSDSDCSANGSLSVDIHSSIQGHGDKDEVFNFPPISVVRKISSQSQRRRSSAKRHTPLVQGEETSADKTKKCVTFHDGESLSL